MRVVIAVEAEEDLRTLPLTMRIRFDAVIFRPVRPDVIVVRIAHRSTVTRSDMNRRKQGIAGTLIIGGAEYVVIPKAEYLRLQDLPPGTVDARAVARRSIAEGLGKRESTPGLPKPSSLHVSARARRW